MLAFPAGDHLELLGTVTLRFPMVQAVPGLAIWRLWDCIRWLAVPDELLCIGSLGIGSRW